MRKSLPTIWNKESFFSSDKAVSAVSENGIGRNAYIGKIIGHDGLTFRRSRMKRHSERDYQFYVFKIAGEGLYEVRNFCNNRENGTIWHAYLLVTSDGIQKLSYEEALKLSYQFEARGRLN